MIYIIIKIIYIFIDVFSKDGSFLIASLIKIIDLIDNNTDDIVLHGVHPGPLHVPIKDKHTFPLTYKFGLNLTGITGSVVQKEP